MRWCFWKTARLRRVRRRRSSGGRWPHCTGCRAIERWTGSCRERTCSTGGSWSSRCAAVLSLSLCCCTALLLPYCWRWPAAVIPPHCCRQLLRVAPPGMVQTAAAAIRILGACPMLLGLEALSVCCCCPKQGCVQMCCQCCSQPSGLTASSPPSTFLAAARRAAAAAGRLRRPPAPAAGAAAGGGQAAAARCGGDGR